MLISAINNFNSYKRNNIQQNKSLQFMSYQNNLSCESVSFGNAFGDIPIPNADIIIQNFKTAASDYMKEISRFRNVVDTWLITHNKDNTDMLLEMHLAKTGLKFIFGKAEGGVLVDISHESKPEILASMVYDLNSDGTLGGLTSANFVGAANLKAVFKKNGCCLVNLLDKASYPFKDLNNPLIK